MSRSQHRQLPVRRLMGDGDIHDASVWRLAGWTPEQIEVSSTSLQDLLTCCPSLDSSHPVVAEFLERLNGPGDRRDPWTALCALVVFWADANDDQALYHRAGFEVLASWRQSMRGHKKPPVDALDELVASYIRLHPDTTAQQLFEHCKGLARVRMVVEESSEQSLTYRVDPMGSKLKSVKWRAFEVRVSRIRRRLESAVDCHRDTSKRGFWWPSLLQPVVVSCTE